MDGSCDYKLINSAREEFQENHHTRNKKIRERYTKNNRIFLLERRLCPLQRGTIHTTSAVCIEPNPRRIHSWGETGSPLSSEKTRSLTSEKAQTAGSGAR